MSQYKKNNFKTFKASKVTKSAKSNAPTVTNAPKVIVSRSKRGSIGDPSQRTRFTLLVDTSQSMDYLLGAVNRGIRDFIDDQKKTASNENRLGSTTIRLVTFGTKSYVVYDGPLEQIPEHSFECSGQTRLFDTVVDELKNLLYKKKYPKELATISPLNAFFVVMTDGHNNIGTRNSEEMQTSVIDARKQNIICSFMAANQDAELVARDYGFDPNTSLTFSAEDGTTCAALRAVSGLAGRSMSQDSQGNDHLFTQLERQQSINVPDFQQPVLQRSPAYHGQPLQRTQAYIDNMESLRRVNYETLRCAIMSGSGSGCKLPLHRS